MKVACNYYVKNARSDRNVIVRLGFYEDKNPVDIYEDKNHISINFHIPHYIQPTELDVVLETKIQELAEDLVFHNDDIRNSLIEDLFDYCCIVCLDCENYQRWNQKLEEGFCPVCQR